MSRLVIFVFVLAFLISGSFQAKDTPSPKNSKYLVEMKHTKEECLQALDAVNESGHKDLLGKIDWGCMDGNHTGYMIVEANSSEAALKDIPDVVKKNSHAYKLNKFTSQQIADFHKK